jgi:REP element-mobilizing transposase RayT
MEAPLPPAHERLPRLAPAAYRGPAVIHWTMTLEHRSTGWLDATHHAALRELLLHTCHRYALACPAYCLMPDHAHFLWLGLSAHSDQRLATAWLRRHWNALLSPHHTLQRQAHDHVLREAERAHDAFATIATYILQNPERANLVPAWRDWSLLGALFPGVHPFDPRATDHWERFWREHHRRLGGPPLPP